MNLPFMILRNPGRGGFCKIMEGRIMKDQPFMSVAVIITQENIQRLPNLQKLRGPRGLCQRHRL
jgi:hypothetical protein